MALREEFRLSAFLIALRSFSFTFPSESLHLYLTQSSLTLSSVEVGILKASYIGEYALV